MIPFEAFFGLTGTPFARDIPVDKLLETASSKELHGRLNHVHGHVHLVSLPVTPEREKRPLSGSLARDWI